MIQDLTIQEKFEAFHRANPHVYTSLVEKARLAVQRGYNKIGMQLLFELVRWDRQVHVKRAGAKDHFKLSNDYASRYARLIMEQETDLRGFFRVRPLEAA